MYNSASAGTQKRCCNMNVTKPVWLKWLRFWQQTKWWCRTWITRQMHHTDRLNLLATMRHVSVEAHNHTGWFSVIADSSRLCFYRNITRRESEQIWCVWGLPSIADDSFSFLCAFNHSLTSEKHEFAHFMLWPFSCNQQKPPTQKCI